MIDGHANGEILSIHNQESEEENRYYISKEGGVNDLLSSFGIDTNFFEPSGRSSLQTYLSWLSPGRPVIFVHNTYTRAGDVHFAQNHLQKCFWCLCPNANLYIESKLPDIQMLMNERANICIGTDSLASNHELCIMSELYTIKKHYPLLSWETLLTWGTFNGATALQLNEVIGSLTPGTKPGILQITEMDSGSKPIVNRII
jgi:cytosine/adenosine deaminase-related metal-dependent hydrolase